VLQAEIGQSTGISESEPSTFASGTPSERGSLHLPLSRLAKQQVTPR